MATSKIKTGAQTRQVDASGTIAANSNGRLTATAPEVPGCKLVGIIGIYSTAGFNGTITEFRLLDGKPTSVVRNIGNSALNITHTFTLLYLPG